MFKQTKANINYLHIILDKKVMIFTMFLIQKVLIGFIYFQLAKRILEYRWIRVQIIWQVPQHYLSDISPFILDKTVNTDPMVDSPGCLLLSVEGPRTLALPNPRNLKRLGTMSFWRMQQLTQLILNGLWLAKPQHPLQLTSCTAPRKHLGET